MIVRDKVTNYLYDVIYYKDLKVTHILHGDKVLEKIKDEELEDIFFTKYEIVKMDEIIEY